jgi:mRNA interferase MazF
MAYARGDIVLVPFPYTDLSAARVRPAVVVSSAVVADDLIVAMVTGRAQTGRTDYELRDWTSAGLARPSWVRAKLATLHERLVRLSPGRLSPRDMSAVDKRLRIALRL